MISGHSEVRKGEVEIRPGQVRSGQVRWSGQVRSGQAEQVRSIMSKVLHNLLVRSPIKVERS